MKRSKGTAGNCLKIIEIRRRRPNNRCVTDQVMIGKVNKRICHAFFTVRHGTCLRRPYAWHSQMNHEEFSMIETRTWMADVLSRLREAFGTRLQYLGLQGSYRRGEAGETSDIDLVVLLDTVGLADLDTYRAIVHAMPEGDKACGFLCGVQDFAAWPPHELFAFRKDTADHFSRLDDFMPPITRDDIRSGARISASALLHPLTHSYLYADAEARPVILKRAFKSAFFLMQVVNFLETDQYSGSKRELLARLDGTEREIIEAGLDFPAWLTAHSERQGFAMLMDWCREVMRTA